MQAAVRFTWKPSANCVVHEKATLGVAFDGDADRALFICHDGQIVNGDGRNACRRALFERPMTD